MLDAKPFTYHDADVTLEGSYVHPADINDKKPVVLVCHDWSGKNNFALQKATALAELGYIGFAVDMYGNGKVASTKEEKMACIQPFIQDRNKLAQRIQAAYESVKKIPQADTSRIGIIGFCFGGMCALDLARHGADLKGTVSFHGLLFAPEKKSSHSILSKILVLHGYDDPMVKPEQVMAFADEMTTAKADWQIHMYGHTLHAFANPQANDPALGTVYDKTADKRSWIAMKNFFAEVF